mmetsp:Transcript_105625/g.297130  ORF Transcript_105625/g.297130 Transcript_105625/m.297130 type:complete len:202 (+) Transcript_105625:952-1557(+)
MLQRFQQLLGDVPNKVNRQSRLAILLQHAQEAGTEKLEGDEQVPMMNKGVEHANDCRRSAQQTQDSNFFLRLVTKLGTGLCAFHDLQGDESPFRGRLALQHLTEGARSQSPEDLVGHTSVWDTDFVADVTNVVVIHVVPPIIVDTLGGLGQRHPLRHGTKSSSHAPRMGNEVPEQVVNPPFPRVRLRIRIHPALPASGRPQ